MFSVHSAMRFIDRFVNLDLSEYDAKDDKIDLLKDRCEKAVNAYKLALDETLKQGVNFEIYSTQPNQKTEIDLEVDESNQNAILKAPRIIIDTETLSDDIKEEVQKVLGKATICTTFAKKFGYEKYNLNDSNSNIIVTVYDPNRNF